MGSSHVHSLFLTVVGFILCVRVYVCAVCAAAADREPSPGGCVCMVIGSLSCQMAFGKHAAVVPTLPP